jgi:lysophospholipase L1-like esterase
MSKLSTTRDETAPRPGETKGPIPNPSLVKFLRVALSVVVFLMLFAGLEGAARIHQYYKMGGLPTYKPRHLVDFYRFYRVNPDYRSATVRVNTTGFRNDHEVAREKPRGTVRIIMMGGSTVWGEDSGPPSPVKIDNRETIAAHLQRILNARAKARGVPVHVEVLNAGVVGYRLFQSLNYFIQYIARFNPDLVIAMDGHNDLDALQMGVDFYHHRNEPLVARAVNAPTFLDLLRWAIKFAEDHSVFVRKVYDSLGQMANRWGLDRERRNVTMRQVTEAEIEEFLHEYEATVRRFDASVRIAGARVLFSLQPELRGERQKRLTPEETTLNQYWSRYAWLHTEARDRLLARMQEVARSYGVWFEDVSDVFKAEPAQVYIDYAHLSNRGAEVMAQRLADLTESLVLQINRRVQTDLPQGATHRSVGTL